MGRRLFTSESVTEGHPDKVADQISDAVLDSILGEDPFARVACETLQFVILVTLGRNMVSTAIHARSSLLSTSSPRILPGVWTKRLKHGIAKWLKTCWKKPAPGTRG